MVAVQKPVQPDDVRQFYLGKPSDQAVAAFLHHQADLPFSYPAVGATQAQLSKLPLSMEVK